MLWEQYTKEIPFNGGRGNWEKSIEIIAFEPKLTEWIKIK